MNTDRLLKLADRLDTVPPDRFDLDAWFQSFTEDECGTAACAVGWACTIPEFNAAGFRAEMSDDGYCLCPQYIPADTGPVYTSWAAVREFFGLTQPEADRLFFAGSYPLDSDPTPAEVAARIRGFVRQEGVTP